MVAPNLTNTFPLRNVVHIKRIQRASRRLNVIPRDPSRGLYLVESASQPGQLYTVALEPGVLAGRCNCPWAQNGGVNCKHVLAALRMHYAQSGALSFWRTRDDARRQHRQLLYGENLYATLRPRRRH
jgi:hypothetical protein